MDEEITREAG